MQIGEQHERGVRPAEAERYLTGVRYPARREDLAMLARERGARDAVYSFLRNLPDREYRNAVDVVESLGPEPEGPLWLT